MGRCRLLDDHEGIRTLLARVERGERTAADLAAALESHLAFEEADVLPLLAERLPTATGPVRTIHEDHQTIRELLGQLPETSGVLERLRDLLLAHFQMEEELILPFAHAHFCDEVLGKIGCAPTGTSHGATS